MVNDMYRGRQYRTVHRQLRKEGRDRFVAVLGPVIAPVSL